MPNPLSLIKEPIMSKILIIEDDQGMVQMLTAALENDGFEVVATIDGTQGIEVAHNEKPDLILLDLIMPVGGGMSALKNLKVSTHTSMIPVIVISGTSDVLLIDDVKTIGIEAFFTKPFDTNDLIAKIQEILPD